jgi:hypothetical protein
MLMVYLACVVRKTHLGPGKQLLCLITRRGGEAVEDTAIVVERNGPSKEDGSVEREGKG